MSLTGEHYDILDQLVPYRWRIVEMWTKARWSRPIRGRRPRLKELNDLGLIEVRTASVSYWRSPLSDRPKVYAEQYVEAVLTAQGVDVRDGRP